MKDMTYGGSSRHHHSTSHMGCHAARGHRSGFGPGGFGPGGPEFGPRRGPRGGRGGRGGRNRGDVRTAILVLLAEQPRHGYDLIRGMEEKSGGIWKPSPGSIYPTLQVLEDEGLITFASVDGRKVASLTPEGEQWLTDHSGEAQTVFASTESAAKAVALRNEMHQLRDAVMLAARQGGGVADEATSILAQTRKDIYALLAGQ